VFSKQIRGLLFEAATLAGLNQQLDSIKWVGPDNAVVLRWPTVLWIRKMNAEKKEQIRQINLSVEDDKVAIQDLEAELAKHQKELKHLKQAPVGGITNAWMYYLTSLGRGGLFEQAINPFRISGHKNSGVEESASIVTLLLN
jgi:hypothetical protein